MEAAVVGKKDHCHGIVENVMFGQLGPMGTGTFNMALDIDMLNDAIMDHRLPVQNMLVAQADGGVTPGQVAMTLCNTNSPVWLEGNFKGESVTFSPLTMNGAEDPTNISFLGYGQSSLGAGVQEYFKKAYKWAQEITTR
ncbi:hypothetical protein AZE42_11585 [Rhizopogon vesiculosus]|uniref:Uncharacterized protein n=1 Tax=Rhizopogon vesiculosus TaxID=180088 RepID=A0A1J8PKM4_9AGAM|nr:hypothetical protein AZE42_11585 [Rhizopogon vesiculosus]